MAEFKFNKEGCQKKLDEIKEFYLKFAGKKGYNPYFIIHGQFAELQKRLNDGETTQELSEKIAWFPLKEPKVFTGPDEVPAKFIAIPSAPPAEGSTAE